MARCKLCDGKGHVPRAVHSYDLNPLVTCPRCHGSGNEPDSICPACGGNGKSKKRHTFGGTCELCHGSGKY